MTFYVDKPGPYSALLRQRDEGKEVSDSEMKQVVSRLANGRLVYPFVYEIKSNESVVGHLIGTYHKCNLAMAKDPVMERVVKSSGRLFVESLQPWYESCNVALIRPSAVFKDATSAKDHFGPEVDFRYLMDCNLCLIAKRENIACEALEMEEGHLKRQQSFERHEQDPLCTFTIDKNKNEYVMEGDSRRPIAKGSISWLQSRSTTEKHLETLEFYQGGSALQIHSIMINTQSFKTLKSLAYEPNVLWAQEKILPALRALKAKDKPIAIAVGVNHLIAKPDDPLQVSLIKILRNSGFTVDRLPKSTEIKGAPTANVPNRIWASIEAEAPGWRDSQPISKLFARLQVEDRPNFWGFYAEKHVQQIDPFVHDFLDSSPANGRIVLDLGCGNSEVLVELLRRGWRVIAVDYSERVTLCLKEMIEKINPQWLHSGQLMILQKDITTFTPPESVDFVMAREVFQYIDPMKIQQTWFKIHNSFLKKGGVFIGSFLCKTSDSSAISAFKLSGAWTLSDSQMVPPLLLETGYEILKCKHPNLNYPLVKFIAKKK